MARFKQQWTPELQDFATQQEKQFNLPAGSLHQIIKQESAGYTDAVSHAGARGLTQLMPATAREMGVSDINDPFQQIQGGAKYYGQLLHNQAKGDPIVAAAMYNSGPNRKAYKTGNLNLLPRETQNYMRQFATGIGGHVEQPTTMGGKILNAVIPAAYGSTTKQPTQQANSNSISLDELDAMMNEQPVQQQGNAISLDELDVMMNEQPVQEPVQEQVQQPQTPPERSLNLDLAKEAAGNLVPSAVGVVKNLAQAAMHPIDTISGIDKVLMGQFYKNVPSAAEAASVSSPEAVNSSIEAAKGFNQNLADRYGSQQAILNTLAVDPAGMAADFAPLGGAVTKAAKARAFARSYGPTTEIGSWPPSDLGRSFRQINAVSKAGKFLTSPVSSAIEAAGPTAGKAIAAPLSMISGIEQPALAAATEAGRQSVKQLGGLLTQDNRLSKLNPFSAESVSPEQTAFLSAKRGLIPDVAVVDQAKTALSNMRNSMGTEYQMGMANLAGANDVLDFAPIKQAFDAAKNIKQYEGKVLDPSANAVKKEIGKVLQDWETSDPTKFHTTYGLDALKQRIGDIRSSTDPHTPARAVVDKVYGGITSTIKRANPEYAKVMEQYSTTIQQLNEIEKELSLGEKANSSTGLRKLQSIMRNNANTSWGHRADLAESLKKAGAPNLDYSLAGQATNAILPRGLGRLGSTIAAGLLGTAGGSIPAALASAVVSSPQVAGALANIAGKGIGTVQFGNQAIQSIPLRGLLASQVDKKNENQGR
jgi:hypothetical protein